MDKFEAAAALDGNEYGSEGSPKLFAQMKTDRLICLFGYSDDCEEMRGADDDEFGTDDLFFTSGGALKNQCEDDDCPYWQSERRQAAKVEVFDGGEEFGMFEFRTSIPHAAFRIIEDGELYGSGIVFSLDDLRGIEIAGGGNG